MEELRAYKLEKHTVIGIDGHLVKDKIIAPSKEIQFIGLDFSIDANIFYGINKGQHQYMQISSKDFDKYIVVFRLLNWSRDNEKENYIFRVLKSDKNETVDLEDERRFLNSFTEISLKS